MKQKYDIEIMPLPINYIGVDSETLKKKYKKWGGINSGIICNLINKERESILLQINIKLMKTGGIYNALTICALAESAHMECMIGCMLESKVSVTAAAHLACARSIITRCDLDAPLLCSEDPIEGGACYKDDHIILSGEPGFGFKRVGG